MQSRDILQLDSNLDGGSDLNVGDIHGNSACLIEVQKKMKPNDRLFLAGDLVDRGNDSLGVITMLWNNPGKIFAVRGNHEEMALKSINSLERILIKLAQEGVNFHEDLDDVVSAGREDEALRIHMHPNNGGEWLLKIFLREILNKKITVKDNAVQYAPDSDIKMIKETLDALPFIIRVKGQQGKSAMNVVHGDMPFDDATLLKRIKHHSGLSDKEKEYAIWAGTGREIPFSDNGRDYLSAITYSGHDIIYYKGIPCVRMTNTVDIDFGCYASGIAIIINHTEKTVDYVSINGANPRFDEKLQDVMDEIADHLEQQKEYQEQLLAKVYECKRISAVHDLLSGWPHQEYYKYIRYFLNNDGLEKFKVRSLDQFHKKLFNKIKHKIRKLASILAVEKTIRSLADTWADKAVSYEQLLTYIVTKGGLAQLHIESLDQYVSSLEAAQSSQGKLSLFPKETQPSSQSSKPDSGQKYTH